MTTATQITPNTAADFDFFEGRQTESSARPQITVRRGGLIVLTSTAVAMLGDQVETVQLAFNRKTGAVALRAAAKDVPGGYRLRAALKGPSRLIGGKRFFAHHGLALSRAQTYPAKDFGNGLVGFLLKVEPVAAVEPVEAAAEESPVARKTRKAA